MINYQSKNPPRNFIMLDKSIDDELSVDAYYLLIKLMKLAPNEHNNNDNLKIKTKFSKRKFDKAKKELVNKGYLDTKQLYNNIYELYIGKESVKNYKRVSKKKENRHGQNQIKKVKESLDRNKIELSKS